MNMNMLLINPFKSEFDNIWNSQQKMTDLHPMYHYPQENRPSQGRFSNSFEHLNVIFDASTQASFI